MVNNYIEHIEAVCQKANNIGMIVLRLARKGIFFGGGVISKLDIKHHNYEQNKLSKNIMHQLLH